MRQDQEISDQISVDVARYLAGDDSMLCQDNDSHGSDSSKEIASSPVKIREDKPAEGAVTQDAAEHNARPSECEAPWKDFMNFESAWGATAPASEVKARQDKSAEDAGTKGAAEHYARPSESEAPWRPDMNFQSPWGAPASKFKVKKNKPEDSATQGTAKHNAWTPEYEAPWSPEMDFESPWGGNHTPASKEFGAPWGVIGAAGSAQAWLAKGAEQPGNELPTDVPPRAARGQGTAAQQASGQPVKAPYMAKIFDEADSVDPARAAFAKESATLSYENARLQEENLLLRQRMERERLQHENALLHMQLQQQQQQRWPGPWAISPQGPPQGPQSPPQLPQHGPRGMMPYQTGYYPGTGLPSHSSRVSEKYGSKGSFGSTSTGSDMDSLSYGSSSYPSSVRSHGGSSGEQSYHDRGIIDENEPKTTRMMRNLPNNYTRKMLRKLVDRKGFGARYNLIYLPIDFKTHANLGYAFLNFVTVDDAEEFTKCFQGFSGWEHDSEKMCEVSWSDTLQGQRAHIERYRSSPVMHESVPDEFKPVLLRDGVRIPFPPPTRKIRAPRHWPQRFEATEE